MDVEVASPVIIAELLLRYPPDQPHPAGEAVPPDGVIHHLLVRTTLAKATSNGDQSDVGIFPRNSGDRLKQLVQPFLGTNRPTVRMTWAFPGMPSFSRAPRLSCRHSNHSSATPLGIPVTRSEARGQSRLNS